MPPVEGAVTLRSVVEADEAFLYRLYASTREDELGRLGWDVTQRAEFLQMQFAAQTRSYRQQFPGAVFDLILVDGEPAGRLYIDRRPAGFHVIDIALLPDFRNAGIGTMLLRRLQDHAAKAGMPVSFYVERSNRALRLYTRLGFKVIDDAGVYLLMEWEPSPADRLVAD